MFYRRGCAGLTRHPSCQPIVAIVRTILRYSHPSYAQPNDLTPYWAPLSPTNEQLLGGAGDDVLIGGGGLDVLDGGTGSNILIQGATTLAAATDWFTV